MSRPIDHQEFLKRLNALVDRTDGGVRALAPQIGVSTAFIHQVRAGKKLPGKRLARFLGYATETTNIYHPIKDE